MYWRTTAARCGWLGTLPKVRKNASHLSLTYFGLQLKYGATAMAYFFILDKKVENWEKNGDGERALKNFTEYCATKGKKC